MYEASRGYCEAFYFYLVENAFSVLNIAEPYSALYGVAESKNSLSDSLFRRSDSLAFLLSRINICLSET